MKPISGYLKLNTINITLNPKSVTSTESKASVHWHACMSLAVPQFAEQFLDRIRVLPVGESQKQRHDSNAPDANTGQHNVAGAIALSSPSDQKLHAYMCVNDVGHPAGQEGEGNGRHTKSITHFHSPSAIPVCYGSLQTLDAPQLLSCDPQHAARHGSNGEDGRCQ